MSSPRAESNTLHLLRRKLFCQRAQFRLRSFSSSQVRCRHTFLTSSTQRCLKESAIRPSYRTMVSRRSLTSLESESRSRNTCSLLPNGNSSLVLKRLVCKPQLEPKLLTDIGPQISFVITRRSLRSRRRNSKHPNLSCNIILLPLTVLQTIRAFLRPPIP